jgi:hypothetical protein
MNELEQKISLKIKYILIILLISGVITLIGVYYLFGGIKEGFEASWRGVGAALNYNMGNGVKSSWENMTKKEISNINEKNITNPAKEESDLNNLNEQIIPETEQNMFANLEGNIGGQVPLPEDELLFFDQNKFSADCCPSDYSNSLGCVCATPEQADYLNKRAGNKSFDDGF